MIVGRLDWVGYSIFWVKEHTYGDQIWMTMMLHSFDIQMLRIAKLGWTLEIVWKMNYLVERFARIVGICGRRRFRLFTYGFCIALGGGVFGMESCGGVVCECACGGLGLSTLELSGLWGCWLGSEVVLGTSASGVTALGPCTTRFEYCVCWRRTRWGRLALR